MRMMNLMNLILALVMAIDVFLSLLSSLAQSGPQSEYPGLSSYACSISFDESESKLADLESP